MHGNRGANLFDGTLPEKGIDVEVLGVQRDNLKYKSHAESGSTEQRRELAIKLLLDVG